MSDSNNPPSYHELSWALVEIADALGLLTSDHSGDLMGMGLDEEDADRVLAIAKGAKRYMDE